MHINDLSFNSYKYTWIAPNKQIIRNNIKIRNDMSFLIFLWFKTHFVVSKMYIMVWVFRNRGNNLFFYPSAGGWRRRCACFVYCLGIANLHCKLTILNKARLGPVVGVIYITSLLWVRISLNPCLEPLPCKHEMTPFAAKLAQFNYLLGAVHVYL